MFSGQKVICKCMFSFAKWVKKLRRPDQELIGGNQAVYLHKRQFECAIDNVHLYHTAIHRAQWTNEGD